MGHTTKWWTMEGRLHHEAAFGSLWILRPSNIEEVNTVDIHFEDTLDAIFVNVPKELAKDMVKERDRHLRAMGYMVTEMQALQKEISDG